MVSEKGDWISDAIRRHQAKNVKLPKKSKEILLATIEDYKVIRFRSTKRPRA